MSDISNINALRLLQSADKFRARLAGGKGEFALFYERLIENGKKPIVALTAVMRKIIITLNARPRDHMKLQS